MKVHVNELDLNVVDEGTGRPVVLLHGWPESSRLWSAQVPPLAAAGYRAIAPDLRGFGQSDRPEGVGHYAGAHAVIDVIQLLDSLGIERAHVVGHDFGAALAWAIAAFFPDRVDHLVVMSVGHPWASRGAGLRQREKSWYTLLFQFEG